MIALFGIPAIISFLAVLGTLIFVLGGTPPNSPPGPEGLPDSFSSTCLPRHFRNRTFVWTLGIPILGWAPFMGRYPWRSFTGLKRRFGNIVSFYLGPQFCIVLQDYDAIRAAFVDQGGIFTGRAHTFAGAEFAKGQDGLTALEGEKWQATRDFVTETFEDLGVGKLRMAKLILGEVLRLQQVIQDHVSWGFDIDALLCATTSNILAMVCFGRRFPHGSDEYRDLTKRFRDMHGALASVRRYPWLRFIGGPLTAKWDGLVISRKKLGNLMSKELTRHEQATPSAEVRDFMDAYLRRGAGNDNEEPAKPIGNEDIVGTLVALYATGCDFTHKALLWSVLIMCLNSPHQKRMQEEMDNIIGSGEPVEFTDRDRLPVTTATLYECLRLSTIGPLGLPRRNLQEADLLGYAVPPNTKVYANIWAAHRDPKYWKSPSSFDPRRFINSDGVVEIPPYFLLFSMGKRSCPGQNLAQMMLFLTFSNLFHRFSFKGAKGHRLPGLDEYGPSALSANPKPFLVQISPRF